jgi:hypothetical protein
MKPSHRPDLASLVKAARGGYEEADDRPEPAAGEASPRARDARRRLLDVTWLSENPWPLAGTLALAAVGLLIALRIRQEAKYLIAALACLALAVGVVVIERVWVTDAERVEEVVLRLADAVERSDADEALALLTPDVTFTQAGITMGGRTPDVLARALPSNEPGAANPARITLRAAIDNAKFDFLSISRLNAHAGRLTRMGQATFRAFGSGSIESSGVRFNFATDAGGSDWSVGLREDRDGNWRISSITAMRVPRGWRLPAP